MGKSYRQDARNDKWRKKKQQKQNHKGVKWVKEDTYSNLDFDRPQPNDWKDWSDNS